MMTKKSRSADGVAKPNPFAAGAPSAAPKPPPSMLIPAGPQEIALRAELGAARERITALETQLKDEQAGRRDDLEHIQATHRADVERLLRELMEVQIKNARLEAEAKQQRQE